MHEVRLIDARHLMRTIMDHEISMSVCMTQDEQCGMARMRRMAIEDIDSAPTVDAKPVRHGHWIPLFGLCNRGAAKCSECGNTLDMHGVNAGRGDANFCPNCGADMRDGGADNG